MKDRQVVWSDKKVLALVTDFVPVTVDVNIFEVVATDESEWFQRVAAEGHYGGRGAGTLQGIYIATPEGELLRSTNEQDASVTADAMKASLREFEPTSPASSTTVVAKNSLKKAAKADPPSNGLVLDVVLRQIYPRKLRTAPGSASLKIEDKSSLSPMEEMQLQRMEAFASRKSEEYWHVPWNRDRAWFTEKEARRFLPEKPTVGAEQEIPAAFVDRIARLHCIDTVRAIASVYPEDALQSAGLRSRVVSIESDVVTIVLEGDFALEETDIPMMERGSDRSAIVPKRSSRSYKPTLLGRARYDLKTKAFTEFQMIALGPKTGGSLFSPFDETQFAVSFRIIADPEKAREQGPRYLSYY